jgi:hypothetical protein
MDKSKEIEILQSLKGDTYFQDFFGTHDIDQMCENIRNDFGLEYCCQFYQKAAIFEQKVNDTEKKSKENTENFVRGLIDDFDGHIPSEIYDRLEDAVGKLFIINWKRQQEYPLTEEEIDWLVTVANMK